VNPRVKNIFVLLAGYVCPPSHVGHIEYSLSARGTETAADDQPFVDGPLGPAAAAAAAAAAALVAMVTTCFIADPAAVYHHILINVSITPLQRR